MYQFPSLKRTRSADNLKIHNNMVISKENQWRYIDFVETDFEYYENSRFLNSNLVEKLKLFLTSHNTEVKFFISKKRIDTPYGYTFSLLIKSEEYDGHYWYSVLNELDIWFEELIGDDLSKDFLPLEFLK